MTNREHFKTSHSSDFRPTSFDQYLRQECKNPHHQIDYQNDRHPQPLRQKYTSPPSDPPFSKIPSSGSTASSTTLGSIQGRSSPNLSTESPHFTTEENRKSSTEYSRQSTILLYQALAGNSTAGREIIHNNGSEENISGSQVKSNSSDDFGSKRCVSATSNGFATNLGMVGNRRRVDGGHCQHYSYNSNEIEDENSKQGYGHDDLKNFNNENYEIIGLRRESGGDGEDEESAKSSSTPNNAHNGPSPAPSSFTDIILQNKKKIGTLIVSIAALWAYSQLRDYKHRKRRYFLRHGRYAGTNGPMNIGATFRYLMQFVSPLAFMKRLQFLPRSQLKDSASLTAAAASTASTSSQPWNSAISTPLSHLLAVAKAGNISKVIFRGSVVSYLHLMKSASPQSQRWSQTTLPSKNSSILNELMSTLIQSGCDDITTLPESLWQRFIDGPAVMVLPFAYLATLYWMMRRLQKEQLGDGNDDDSFTIKGNSTHTTTFDDVAGIDSSLQELAEVVNYIRQPAAFHSVGAHPPRGILLYGRAGTGKTLLARAIAGEAERKSRGIGGAAVDSFAVCSGSDFVETYVGRGAARVRALFRGVRQEAWRNFERRKRQHALERARMQRMERTIKRYQSDITSDATGKSTNGAVTRAISDVGERVVEALERVKSLVNVSNDSTVDSVERDQNQTPVAIIFIDEIDALAKRRDSGMGLPHSLGGGGCDEREQTLNALLTEMDGFSTGIPAPSAMSSLRTGPDSVIVIVIAATNRKDVLDPAILRPGRFDRHVEVPLPDANGREAILRVHARRIRLDRHASLRELAWGNGVDDSSAPTENFSGADLKNVINEAALLAVRSGSSVVQQNHLLSAAQKVRRIVDSSGSRFERTCMPQILIR
ncbi:hypothetical protein ACHAXS_003083 [Conticribra weissflogii]